jgi:hypothetical protein
VPAVRLVCPLCGTVVADGGEPSPGRCPGCGAHYAGGGASAPEGVSRALEAWSVDADAEEVARRLFSEAPAPPPAPAAAITSDARDGFYLWWVFVRDDGSGPGAVLAG